MFTFASNEALLEKISKVKQRVQRIHVLTTGLTNFDFKPVLI